MKNKSNWETNADAMFVKLKAISKKLGMPQFYKEDLDIDHKTLLGCEGHQFIWLVRECGTALVPLRAGYSEIAVQFYLRQGPAYLVDPDTGALEKISEEKAIELIKLPPIDVGLIDSAETLVSKVTDVIDKWDAWLFSRPKIDSNDWSSWAKYCEDCENFVMADFVLKAQKRLAKLKS